MKWISAAFIALGLLCLPARAQFGPTSSGVTPQAIVAGCAAGNNQLLYVTSGACAGLTTANNSVAVTSAGGVPSWATTLPSGLTIPSPTMTAPTLGAASATTINGVAVAIGQISGATSNTNATAGNIGEFISAQVFSPGNALTTNSLLNLANVTLTAGDWDCRAVMSEVISATTTVQQLSASISSANNKFGTQGTEDTAVVSTTPVSAQLEGPLGTDLRVGPVRKSLAGTTTFYLVEGATFAASNMRGYGAIECRRVR